MQITYCGQTYEVSEAAYDALCACGPEIAAAKPHETLQLSDEATRTILRAEGYAEV